MRISFRSSLTAVPAIAASLMTLGAPGVAAADWDQAASPLPASAAAADATPPPAVSPAAAPLPSDLRAWVRQLITLHINQDKQNGVAYRYHLERETKKGIVEYRDCVESDRILVTRLLAVNGQALNAEQRGRDDARLKRISATQDAQRESLDEQREEARKINNILVALPDAFVFTDGGRTTTAEGVVEQRLDFKADPNFRPPSREAMALQGMAGSLWVDMNEGRLYKVQGELVRPVSFGWGFLGKLKRGGKFLVEYKRMPSGRWMLMAMNIDFRASLFMGLSSAHLLERRIYTNFQRAQTGMSAAEAVEVLTTTEAQPDLRAATDQKR